MALKINEIHIYGYGKLEDFNVRNLDDLNIFYGENEAGKSTIMSFIHSVLFGFPTRQQSELRYEPKKLAKYGGQLIVTFPSGKTVIERVKGKSTGDVKVLMEDGTQGGEELLKELLSNMDKSLFQSIFSFNLHGLQNIQQMKNEDLGKFLFSTGTLGTDRLLATENFLQKRLDALYKQSGKKPLINEKLTEIKLLSQDLKKAEQHNDQYWQYLDEKETLEAKLSQFQLQSSNLQSQFTRLQEWKRLLPIINEESALQEEWAQIAINEFPNEGISHLDEFKKILFPYESKIGSLTSRIKDLENEIKDGEPNHELLAHELAIYNAVENLPLYEQLKQESNQLALTLTELNREISELQQNLHITLDESLVKNSNTSVFMREKTANAQKKEQHLKEKKQELDEQFQQTKLDLEELEAQIGQYSEILLSDEERVEVLQQKSLAENRSQYEKELSEIENQKQIIKNIQIQEAQQAKVQEQQGLLQLLVLSAIFVLLAGWGLVEKQWVVVAVALAGFLYLFIFRKRKPSSKGNNVQMEFNTLKEKETLLTSMLGRTVTKGLEDIVQQLAEDDRLREKQNILRIKWDQRNEQYEKILQSYELWEQDSRLHHLLLIDLGKELGIPKDIALTFVHDAFILIEKLKGVYAEKRKVIDREKLVLAELSEIEVRIRDLAKQFLLTGPPQLQNAAYLLRQELKRHQELQIHYENRRKKLADMMDEYQQYIHEKEQIMQEIIRLFEQAKVESEEEFRTKGVIADRKRAITDRLNEIQRQLEFSSISLIEREELKQVNNPDQQINLLLGHQEECQQRLMKLQEQLAEVKHQIVLLEDGGTYAELLHKFKHKQSEVNDDAKIWARYAIAKDLLSKAVEQYKNQRLPKMIKKAETFLRLLTEDQYIRIHTPKEGSSFVIESQDHTFYEPNELSQATSEQIYVSLRLALATTLYEKYQFPIIIDDSFVNFDHIRTGKVIQLLNQLQGHQIIIFTCHRHLFPYFNKGKIIEIKEHLSTSLQH